MAHGAQTELNHLIQLRHSAGDLRLFARSKATSQLAGDVRTSFRGRGLDFDEIRQYQDGDDIRAIDWRVTARTGTAHTKLYQEERERPVLVVIDQRVSMAFGSQCCFKSVQAAEAASLLCWAALAQNDRVGGFVFNDHEHHDIRPARSKSSVLQLLSAVNQFNHGQRDAMRRADFIANDDKINEAIIELRRIAKPGTAIFIISDFIGLSEEGIKQLHLLKKHCDINALFISDPMERELPGSGISQFTDGRERHSFNLASHQLTTRFSEQFNSRWQQLRQAMNNHGIGTIPVGTEDEAIDILRHHYRSAARNKSRASAQTRQRNRQVGRFA